MKKGLLIISLAGAVAANAQSYRTASPERAVTAAKKGIIEQTVLNPTPLPSASATGYRYVNPGNSMQVLFEEQIGTAGNAFGVIGGPKTNVWFDLDLNTIAFTHRHDPTGSTTTSSGFIEYDYSPSAGAQSTWSINQGFLYRDTTFNTTTGGVLRGRYPQGLIYNPPGNTNPTSAYMTCFGPCTDNTNWIANYGGTIGIGTGAQQLTNSQEVFETAIAGTNATIGNGGHVVKNTGKVWFAGGSNGINYNDTIYVWEGDYDGSGGMNYTIHRIAVPVCTDDGGSKMHIDQSITFSDDGQTGYLVVLGNDWACNVEPQDSGFGILVYMTNDYGQTWNEIIRPDLNLLDPVLANGQYLSTTAFEVDCGMDKNNDLHIAVAIGPYAGGGAISTAYGLWGIFDIYYKHTPNQWYGQLLGKPQTFRGNFGDGSTTNPAAAEDSRPQVSRSWDGSYIYISWFDTDTLQYGTTENIFPDMHTVGYNVDADLWTAETNLTASGLVSTGGCTFGCVSYYTIPSGNDQDVPLVIAILQQNPITVGLPVQHWYIGGLTMSNFNQTLTPILLHPLDVNNPASANTFQVSRNYPNPFTGKTMVDVNLVKGGDVTIEVSNMVGQVISTTTYESLQSGANTLTIDATQLSKGIYVYKVKAGNDSVTRTMTVE